MTDNEIDILKNELEHEKTCREAAAWQNGELEKQIMSIQEELRKSDYTWEHDDELIRENNKHKQLMECIEALRDQLPILRERIKNAKVCGIDCKLKHDDLNINLDILTPAELLRTVKRFERLKTDLLSTLRSKEWRLDSESKLFVRVNDQRTYLQNELLICQNNILRLQKNGPYWHVEGVIPITLMKATRHYSVKKHLKILTGSANAKVAERLGNRPVYEECGNVQRKNDERVLDPKRGPIKKMFGERLPPIPTQ